MFCQNCGSNVENAKFCPNCGAAMEAEVAPEAVEIIPEAPAKSTKGAKVLSILGLILGIVSLLCALLYTPVQASLLLAPGLTIILSILFGAISFVASIGSLAGFVLSIIALVKAKKCGFKRTMAVFGLLTSIIAALVGPLTALIVGVLYIVFGILASVVSVLVYSLGAIGAA